MADRIYTHLTLEEREQIAIFWLECLSQSEMARREREAVIEQREKLKRFVVDRLTEGWTPEPIAGSLMRGEEKGLRGLGTKMIYRYIHRARQKSAKLWKLLPCGKAKPGRCKWRVTNCPIRDRRLIHERPDDVQTRQKAGDWEADLMICKRTRPVLVLHERRSRLTIASKLPPRPPDRVLFKDRMIFLLKDHWQEHRPRLSPS